METRQRRRYVSAAFFLLGGILLLASAGRAQGAFPVTIDPGAYAGEYSVDNQAFVSGGSMSALAPGVHEVRVGAHASFTFRVATDGSVTIETNPGAATAAGSTVSFRNTTVTIDPASYLGQWRVFRVTEFATGLADVVVVPGGRYLVTVGNASGVFVAVADDGTVASENLDAAVGSGTTVTFRNASVQIDPVGYLGHWAVTRVTEFTVGSAAVVVMPSNIYAVSVGPFQVFLFSVAADGTASIFSNPAAATASASTVTLANTQVLVNPGGYVGDWRLTRASHSSGCTGVGCPNDWFTGFQSLTLVPGSQYQMSVGDVGFFVFSVDAAGQVLVPGGGAAEAFAETLTLNNVTVRIDPGAYAGLWLIGRVRGNAVGAADLTLVPGVQYRLVAGGSSGQFAVANPCAISPPVLAVGGASFSITCGAADSDEDGVPDAVDNCAFDSNPDQLDLDNDLVGDACDADKDGDGVANVDDNCEAFPNPGQYDFDGDGIGDACDDDADGDSVVDVTDNCPGVRNPDQADSDFDGAGDACDPDNDNDLVPNDADNCPLTPNPSQADFDVDGQGDVCDGDTDGDGVLNDADLCAVTPLDQAVNSQGCSGAQHIERSCAVVNFVQHGQYVRCVAEAANAAADAGLIAPSEKARFVSDAATKKK